MRCGRHLNLKAGLLEFVHGQGFLVTDYLKRKAILSISEAPHGKDVSRPERKKRAESIEVPTDILHPDLYKELVQWRNAEAVRQGLPAYTILRQNAILGISNLLPADEDTLLRIPYMGKKGVEKYGKILLDMVRRYR